MRNARLERVEAVVERQQGMPPEGDDDRLVLQAAARVERGSFGPIRASVLVWRERHFCTVVGLIP